MALKRRNEVIIIKVHPTSYMITNNSLEVDVQSVFQVHFKYTQKFCTPPEQKVR